jgi:hypothetical protein
MTTTLIIISVIIALLIIIAVSTGTQINIERSIRINKPIKQVFDYVKLVKNHGNFSVWVMADPDMKKEFRGSDGNVGFVYGWDSSRKKNVGAGEQEITGITEGENIQYEIRFFRPMQNVATAKFVFESVSDDQTEVQWGFYSSMKFPMNCMKFLFQRILGKDLETSLQNLKNILEKQAVR